MITFRIPNLLNFLHFIIQLTAVAPILLIFNFAAYQSVLTRNFAVATGVVAPELFYLLKFLFRWRVDSTVCDNWLERVKFIVDGHDNFVLFHSCFAYHRKNIFSKVKLFFGVQQTGYEYVVRQKANFRWYIILTELNWSQRQQVRIELISSISVDTQRQNINIFVFIFRQHTLQNITIMSIRYGVIVFAGCVEVLDVLPISVETLNNLFLL